MYIPGYYNSNDIIYLYLVTNWRYIKNLHYLKPNVRALVGYLCQKKFALNFKQFRQKIKELDETGFSTQVISL